CPDLDGAEESEHHLRTVQHQEEDAFFRAYGEPHAQCRANAVHPVGEKAVRDAALFAFEGNRIRAPLGDVAIDEVLRGVERLTGSDHGRIDYAHRNGLCSGRSRPWRPLPLPRSSSTRTRRI